MTQFVFVEGSETLDEGVKALIGGAIEDYTRWQTDSIGHIYSEERRRSGLDETPERTANRELRHNNQLEESIAKFTDSLCFTRGKKYIKVMRGRESVHCFIVATSEDKQFKIGDVLRAETWSRPARNKARGNVFTGFNIQWTGASYL